MKTLLTLLFLVGFALGQAPPNYDRVKTAVTLDATTDSVLVSGNGYGTAGFQITGTWSGTLRFTGTIDGTNWVGLPAMNAQSRASDTTATGNGLYFVSPSGARYVKVKFTTYTSGEAVVTAITTDDPVAAASSGGGAVTNAGTFAVQAGQSAHDAAIAGAPVRIGARAVTADYTAVAGGDAADLIATVDGKQIIKPHAIRASTWSYAAASGGLVNTTAVTIKAAAAASIRNCLTGIQVINAHATVSTEVLVRDGAAGTVLHRGWAQAVGGGFAANFEVPICGTAATLMEVVNVTTGSAVYVNAQGFISAE